MNKETIKFYKNEKELPISIKGNHLQERQKHIIRQKIYNYESPIDYLKFMIGGGCGKILESQDTVLIDFYETNDNIRKLGLLGECAKYVISQVDGMPKRSCRYMDCTSVIVCGEDAEGNQISFMTHQNPIALINDTKKKFENDLITTITKLKNICKSGTIDAVIAGGNYYDNVDNGDPQKRTCRKKYIDSISCLKNILESQLIDAKNKIQITPVVIAGPDISMPITQDAFIDIIFDTQARIAFIARPDQYYELSNNIYSSNDLKTYCTELDKLKQYFKKWTPVFLRTKLEREVERQLSISGGKLENVSPAYEQNTYNDFKDSNIQVWSIFIRTGNQINDLYIDTPTNLEATEYIGNYDEKAMALKENKIKYIKNINSFIYKIINNLKVISEIHYEINNSQETFGYFYDEASNNIDFVIGKHGFYHVEKKVYKDIILQNTSMFIESFHRFLDEYVSPECRSRYTKQVHDQLKIFLQKNISNDKFSKIFDYL